MQCCAGWRPSGATWPRLASCTAGRCRCDAACCCACLGADACSNSWHDALPLLLLFHGLLCYDLAAPLEHVSTCVFNQCSVNVLLFARRWTPDTRAACWALLSWRLGPATPAPLSRRGAGWAVMQLHVLPAVALCAVQHACSWHRGAQSLSVCWAGRLPNCRRPTAKGWLFDLVCFLAV